MKKSRRILRRACALGLAAGMFMTMAVGCKSQESSSQNSGASGAAANSGEPVEFSILLLAPADFSPDNNPWVEAINEKANCKINWIAYPSSNIWEKRNTTMAGQDYPDVIIMNSTNKGLNDNLYESMVKNNIILPLDEYLENAPNIMKYTNETCWDAVRHSDGHIYMVPRSTIIREDFMANRQDWRETLGMEVPETIEDWRNYYKAVATQDPDGDGVANTYGTTEASEMMTESGTINLDYFARAWHADKNWYVDENGEVFYGMFAKDGRFKNALAFYRDMVQDGSLDPDFISNKGVSAKQERLKKNAISSMRLFAGNVDRELNVLRSVAPEAELELIDFPALEDEKYESETLLSTNAGLYNGWALTTAAKGKEQQIIDVMDWMLSDEGWNLLLNGVEGVHYEKEGDTITRLDDYAQFSKWSGYTQILRRPNDESLWLKNVIPEYYDRQKEWLDFSIEYMNKYDQQSLMGILCDAETEFYKKDIYTKEFLELTVEIIYGEKPLEAWDEFIEKVYSEGWQEVTDYYNQYYQEHKA